MIDIMHGLEPQTIESINLLKARKVSYAHHHESDHRLVLLTPFYRPIPFTQTPFVVALNKIDRCYEWNAIPNAPVQVM